MSMRLPRFALPASLVLSSLSFISPQIAMASEASAAEAPALPSLPTELPKTTKFEDKLATDGAPAAADTTAPAATTAAAAPAAGDAAPASTTFTSDGQPMHIESLGITIAPPSGWQVETNTGSLSVVMSEPRQTAPDYEKPKYQRNITLATIHQASPIDEKRAAELQAQMQKSFSTDGSVSDFQILEHKFFNYRGANDGLIVYSSLKIGDYPMMQMHVLVSGQDKQFLLTYTDLAERFSDAKDGGFERAWNSMVSIEVTGATPARIDQYIPYAVAGGVVAFLGLVLFLLRRRAKKVDFGAEADALFEGSGHDSGELHGSMLATLAGAWKLSGNSEADEESDLEFSSAAAPLKTRQTEYVSNY